jgi:hypothetical protein
MSTKVKKSGHKPKGHRDHPKPSKKQIVPKKKLRSMTLGKLPGFTKGDRGYDPDLKGEVQIPCTLVITKYQRGNRDLNGIRVHVNETGQKILHIKHLSPDFVAKRKTVEA